MSDIWSEEIPDSPGVCLLRMRLALGGGPLSWCKGAVGSPAFAEQVWVRVRMGLDFSICHGDLVFVQVS